MRDFNFVEFYVLILIGIITSPFVIGFFVLIYAVYYLLNSKKS